MRVSGFAEKKNVNFDDWTGYCTVQAIATAHRVMVEWSNCIRPYELVDLSLLCWPQEIPKRVNLFVFYASRQMVMVGPTTQNQPSMVAQNL